ncbi:hypothetical protein C8Q80DRAFT_1259448 [Daedaleopsis nitida]|nr:hypothetical protein C8Q80DRAFT_1259448 [Daedaleopsis nitida]
MPSGWDIYAKELWPLGYGHPLWGPEPCMDFGAVHLGDIGYLQKGHFCFLFNAMLPADDPLNAQRGVPEKFEIFDPPDVMRRHHPNAITQTQLHSRNIHSVSVSVAASTGLVPKRTSVGAALRYQCSDDSGALLLLKRPGNTTYLDCDLHIKRYMRTHIQRWYEFAIDYLGIELEEQDIIFVSGFTKTAVWAEAAFANGSSRAELTISGGCFVPAVSGEFSVSMSRCVDASVFSRAGPHERVSNWKDNLATEDDQTIFLNFHKAKRRRFLGPTVLRAAAGPHDLQSDRDNDYRSECPVYTPQSSCEEEGLKHATVRYTLAHVYRALLSRVPLRLSGETLNLRAKRSVSQVE